MVRMLLAAAAAFALVSASPALAGSGCDDCKNCPHHKVAAADKEKKEVACPCGDGKECKCGEKCQCAHCSAKKEKKEGTKT